MTKSISEIFEAKEKVNIGYIVAICCLASRGYD